MGSPLRVRYSKRLMEVLGETLGRFYRMAGLLQTRSCVALGYRDPSGAAFAMHAFALQRNNIPFFHLDPGDLLAACATLRERRATALFSHPGLALEVANLALTRICPSVTHLDVLLCSGMPLSDSGRDFIDRTLNATTFRCAGATEISLLGFECDRRIGLHLLDDIVYAEIPSSTENTTQPAELLISTIRNDAHHLFRYCLGDNVIVRSTICPCGSHQPIIELTGRIMDKVDLPSWMGGPLCAASLQTLINEVEGLTGGFQCFIGLAGEGLHVDLHVEAWRSEADAIDEIRCILQREITRVLTPRVDESVAGKPLSISVRFRAPGELGHGGVKYRRLLLES